ncbi:uncharacterized protein MKK02DRAFT_40049 [Dioszegia hungarica]|uniref:Uncharacterized protein n=1 Tax=Dioszegia hungarica TaxID=4972 RepID=A0AA38HHP7_9TREE|nr:uncharacterized protein MKK02DRAFT_40049 [Dioszegia hungarica]KAI9639724.1 hypothetical protein MKK02DRAFT_40049 [Dioszegia hungarica]
MPRTKPSSTSPGRPAPPSASPPTPDHPTSATPASTVKAKKAAAKAPKRKRDEQDDEDDERAKTKINKWTKDERLLLLERANDIVRHNLWTDLKTDNRMKVRQRSGVLAHWDAFMKKMVKEVEGQA